MNVLVLGDSILDHYQYGNVTRQSPEDPSIPVFDVERSEYRLGGCMNVAANIRSISTPKIGDRTSQQFNVYLSTVFSRFTGKMLYNKGIQCDDSSIRSNQSHSPDPQELIKTRVINLATNKQLIRIDNNKSFSSRSIEEYKENLGVVSNKFDAIIISDYSKGLVNECTLETLKNYTGPVFVDSKNPNLSFWKNISNCFVKINDKEYENSKGGHSLQNLIVTKGRHGCDLYSTTPPTRGQLVTHFDTSPIENPEVTGCGDVFLAGLVVSYLRNSDLSKSIKFANMCAGISAKNHGTTEVML